MYSWYKYWKDKSRIEQTSLRAKYPVFCLVRLIGSTTIHEKLLNDETSLIKFINQVLRMPSRNLHQGEAHRNTESYTTGFYARVYRLSFSLPLFCIFFLLFFLFIHSFILQALGYSLIMSVFTNISFRPENFNDIEVGIVEKQRKVFFLLFFIEFIFQLTQFLLLYFYCKLVK